MDVDLRTDPRTKVWQSQRRPLRFVNYLHKFFTAQLVRGCFVMLVIIVSLATNHE